MNNIFTAVKQTIFGGQRLQISTDIMEFTVEYVEPILDQIDPEMVRDIALSTGYIAACYLTGKAVSLLMVMFPWAYWIVALFIALDVLTILFATLYMKYTSF